MKKDQKKRRIPVGRVNATQPGYQHKHGAGFVTIWKEPIIVDGEKKFKTVYKHRPHHDRSIGTNNERVVQMRKQRDPNYNPVRGKLVEGFKMALDATELEKIQVLAEV